VGDIDMIVRKSKGASWLNKRRFPEGQWALIWHQPTLLSWETFRLLQQYR
jgi:hypothetical protein